MKKYDMKHIRNVALVGATGAGKTTIAEHILFNAKQITRIGTVDEGNTVMDYNSEEIQKKMSMALGLAQFEWNHKKINMIDTPGSSDFANEQIAASTAVETLLFVSSAISPFDVTFEQSIEVLANKTNAKALIINRMDNEGADFFKALEIIKENSDLNPVPMFLPIGAENKFEGVIDVVKGKAYIKGNPADIPADMVDAVEEAKMALTEAVAETDDELLEKYFEEGELSQEELLTGVKKGIKDGTIFPVFATSASENVGIVELMNAINEYFPSPEDKSEVPIEVDGKIETLQASPDGKLFGYVFKSFTDPNLGDIAYVRVFSGKLTSGTEVYIPEKDGKDRIGSMYFFKGKHRFDTDEISAGDIGGLVKVKVMRSYNSIVPIGEKYRYPKIELPTPVYWQAVKAVNQSDEDKIGSALSKLLEEDPTMNLEMNIETSENVISGLGELQIGLVQKRLKSRYKIDAEFTTPSVPYKETIQGFADVSYKHKKQTGGKGQYAEVYFKVSPLERGAGFEFVNSIVGGTIPSKYIPAIEKGLHEILKKGIISGNPIVDIKVEVYFGSYHDVDSSEMAFKIATWQCLKKAFEVAKPILLEPVHKVQIIIPSEYMGDVMGDISTRRGKIIGMEQKGKKQILNAHLPLAELFGYFPALKSLTQGRGRFIQEFSHYEKVPEDIAKKVIEKSKED